MLIAILKKFEIGKTGRPFALLSDLQLRLAMYVIHTQELGFELNLSCLILKKIPYNWVPKIRYQAVQQECYYSYNNSIIYSSNRKQS
jgi:hypothetical protein